MSLKSDGGEFNNDASSSSSSSSSPSDMECIVTTSTSTSVVTTSLSSTTTTTESAAVSTRTVANRGMECISVSTSATATTSTTTTTGGGTDDDGMSDDETLTLIAKFGKDRIALSDLPHDTTIASVKEMLRQRTGVLPKRQKLIGLALDGAARAQSRGTLTKVTDEVTVSQLKFKPSKKQADAMEFILMGTPEEHIFVDPSERDDLPDVVDDFDLDFNAGSELWVRHVANGENLRKFTESTVVHVMNEPRPGKPLLVLDLDHTLLDFSSKALQRASTHAVGDSSAAVLKRPYMDEFLCATYQSYDLVVWSQTSWRWLETKLTELGMLTHPGYRFCFVLDKTSMFSVTSTRRDGVTYQHYVKPLEIIWKKFPVWGSHNTVHLDDLARNFALNLGSGLKVTGYYRKKSKAKRDRELQGLIIYLDRLAKEATNFDEVNFAYWMDVVSGKRALLDDDTVSSKKRES